MYIIVKLLKKVSENLLSPSLECLPSELIQYFADVALVTPASTRPALRSRLYLLYFVYIIVVAGFKSDVAYGPKPCMQQSVRCSVVRRVPPII